MEPLTHLRILIASVDQELVPQLVRRASLPHNEHLYDQPGSPVGGRNELASAFIAAGTPAARIHLLRPVYLMEWLDRLCESGEGSDRSACFAADTACLDAVARRLALSVHVATRKQEAVPEALQAAIDTRDPVTVETAITHPEVEVEVLARIRAQAMQLTEDSALPDRIVDLYAEWIIPLSRKIQVAGLLAE